MKNVYCWSSKDYEVTCKNAKPVEGHNYVKNYPNMVKAYGTFGTIGPLTILGPKNIGQSVTIPLTYESTTPITTGDKFLLNPDGSVSILNPGVYLVNAKVQVASGSGVLLVVSVNGNGLNVPYYNEGGATGNGDCIVTSIVSFQEGDLVTLGIISYGETTLGTGDQFYPVVNVTTASLRLIKISDPIEDNSIDDCFDLMGAYGTFANYDELTVKGSGIASSGTIIPLKFISSPPNNSINDFKLNDDGTITIKTSGVYMVSAKLQVACGSGAIWGIFINNGGLNVPYYNESGVTGNGTGVISNILSLNKEDILSIGLISRGKTTLTWGNDFFKGVAVSTVALRLFKIAENRKCSKWNFSKAYGTFGTTMPLEVLGSKDDSRGNIIPLNYISPSPISTENTFSIEPDGSIFVNESGIYIADAKLQVASDCGAVWCIQINSAGTDVDYYNSAGVTGNNTSTISNIISLKAGDFVSLGLVSFGRTKLGWGNVFDTSLAISTATLRLVKIDD